MERASLSERRLSKCWGLKASDGGKDLIEGGEVIKVLGSEGIR